MADNRTGADPVVNAHNEWDPLEEVIVGVVEGAMVPPWDTAMEATLHRKSLWDYYKELGRRGIPLSERVSAI